jgi:GGDEF domain-containing protein
VQSSAQAVKIAERVAEATTAIVGVGNGLAELHTSVGVAWTTEALDADAFIARADYAMYQSKLTLHKGGDALLRRRDRHHCAARCRHQPVARGGVAKPMREALVVPSCWDHLLCSRRPQT